MTTLRTAAQQALEALKLCIPKPRSTDDDYAEQGWKEHNAAITALRAALAAPQEPLTVTELQEALVYTNLIDRDAIEDPEGYDEGSTVAQIDELHRAIKRAHGIGGTP